MFYKTMPTYIQDGGLEPYRKRYRRQNKDDLQTFYARLDKEQFKFIKKHADQFATHKLIHSKKVRPSSYKFIAHAPHPTHVVQAIEHEHRKHHDPTDETHLGGGIIDGANAIGQYIWNTYTPIPWLYDKLGWSTPKRPQTPQSQLEASLIAESYKDLGKRDENVQGYNLLPDYSSDYTTVYEAPDGSLHASIRGSKTAKDWLYHDALIAMRNRPGKDETQNLQQFMVNLAKENPDRELTVNAHSLSGSFVQNAFSSATVEDAEWLDHYDQINMFNPGASPFGNLTGIQDFIQDPRVNLFLNKSDLISEAYVTQLPDGYDRVTWGETTISPLAAHTYEQWTADGVRGPLSNNNEPLPERDHKFEQAYRQILNQHIR